jgi:uncharacterized membrane protein
MHPVGQREGTRVAASVSLVVVLGATLLTLGAGLAMKAPCASGSWTDGRQYRHVCYSDVIPLYGTEHLQGGRLPYLDPCPTGSGLQCDEYPVVTMWYMRLAAWIGHGYTGFFYVNVVGLAAAAMVTSWALYRIAGARALYFAAAPTLLIYAFMNWDLLAVGLAAAGSLAFFRKRDGVSGLLIGLGAATKLFPGLLVVPFVLARLRAGERVQAAVLGLSAAGTYALVNLPFALFAPHQWATFFRFNTSRPVDWDSIWFISCHGLHASSAGCGLAPDLVNTLSVMIFVVAAVALWIARSIRQPDFPAWTFAFPLLVVFLLANKVYSPQYGLWLLPWFALALPSPTLFVLFELSDVSVFLTRFTYFGRLAGDGGDPAFAGYHGAPLGAFELAVAVRAVILLACLVVWVRGLRERPALEGNDPVLDRGPALVAAPA